MQKRLLVLIIIMLLTGVSVAHAQTDSSRRMSSRQGFRNMPPQQRKEMMQKMRARYDSLSPEQKAAAKEGMKQARERIKNMTPEEKAAAKEQMQEMKKKMDDLSPEQREKMKQRIQQQRMAKDSIKKG